MELLEIKIVITDGVKEAKTSVNVAEYKKMKSLSGVSLVDLQVNILLEEIEKSIESNS